MVRMGTTAVMSSVVQTFFKGRSKRVPWTTLTVQAIDLDFQWAVLQLVEADSLSKSKRAHHPSPEQVHRVRDDSGLSFAEEDRWLMYGEVLPRVYESQGARRDELCGLGAASPLHSQKRNTLATSCLQHNVRSKAGSSEVWIRRVEGRQQSQVIWIVAEVAPVVEAKGRDPIGGWIDPNGQSS